MKSYCISHVKDVDGLGSAALTVAATGAEIALTDYDGLMEALEGVPKGVDEVVICDVGTDSSSADRFVRGLRRIALKSRVTYIDHHYASQATLQQIRKSGVRMVHDLRECASMLTYLTFRERLPEQARMLALCGAVTDYMDSSPNAGRLMEQVDRQFVLLEATMLSFALARSGDRPGFPERVVRELAEMKLPHEMKGVPELAVRQMREMARIGAQVRKEGKRMKRVAYMVTPQLSTGSVAKLLIGAFEVPVGVALRQKEKGWYEVSLRGTSECRIHLGKVVGVLAAKMGGNGGGHAKAAGCRIPAGSEPELLEALDKRV